MEWAEIEQRMMYLDLDDPSMESVRNVYFRIDKRDNGFMEDVIQDIRSDLGEFMEIFPADIEFNKVNLFSKAFSELENYKNRIKGKVAEGEEEYFNNAMETLRDGIKNKDMHKTAEGLFRLEYYAGSLLGGD